MTTTTEFELRQRVFFMKDNHITEAEVESAETRFIKDINEGIWTRNKYKLKYWNGEEYLFESSVNESDIFASVDKLINELRLKANKYVTEDELF